MTQFGNKVFVDAIKWQWDCQSGLYYNWTCVLIRRGKCLVKRLAQRECQVGARQRLQWHSCQPMSSKNWRPPQEARKRQEEFSLQVSEAAWPCQHLDFELQASGSERVNFWCFESSSLWFFVTPAPGKVIQNSWLGVRTWAHPAVPWCGVELRSFTCLPKGLMHSASFFSFCKLKTIFAYTQLSTMSPLLHSGTETGKPAWWFHTPVLSIAPDLICLVLEAWIHLRQPGEYQPIFTWQFHLDKVLSSSTWSSVLSMEPKPMRFIEVPSPHVSIADFSQFFCLTHNSLLI